MSFTCKEPKLRFPEFRGEWMEKKLEDISIDMIQGVNTAIDIPEYVLHGVPMLKANDIIDGEIDFGNVEHISNKTYQGYSDRFKAKKNDFLFSNIGARLGTGSLLKHNIECSFAWNVMRIIPNATIEPKYLNYRINSPYFFKLVILNQSGSGMGFIPKKILKDLKIKLPRLSEQEKIASFLSVVDAKIEQLTCKEKLLEKYKKSVLQKLFSQELRFTCDDGSKFPEWEEKKLGEVGQIITGKTPSTSNDDFWDGDIQFITPTDISENTKYQILTVRKIVKQSNTKILPKGSIVYTCIASIGKMAITTLPSITNQQINSIIVFENVNNEFLYYALLKLTPYIKSTQANTTLPIINKTEFSKFKINLPSLPEQTKIANFLSTIDEKLLHVKAQILQTQQFKKALLQQMFV